MMGGSDIGGQAGPTLPGQRRPCNSRHVYEESQPPEPGQASWAGWLFNISSFLAEENTIFIVIDTADISAEVNIFSSP